MLVYLHIVLQSFQHQQPAPQTRRWHMQACNPLTEVEARFYCLNPVSLVKESRELEHFGTLKITSPQITLKYNTAF